MAIIGEIQNADKDTCLVVGLNHINVLHEDL